MKTLTNTGLKNSNGVEIHIGDTIQFPAFSCIELSEMLPKAASKDITEEVNDLNSQKRLPLKNETNS